MLYFLLVGPLWKALAMLGWGIGVVSMIDQFLRPWLIGQAVQIPVLFLVFSVLGGLALYGLIGLFVGPVLVSLLMTAIQIYREEYHNAETDTPASPCHTVLARIIHERFCCNRGCAAQTRRAGQVRSEVRSSENLELRTSSSHPSRSSRSVSRGHRHPYSSGMVMAIPPITSLSLKSRFGLSR